MNVLILGANGRIARLVTHRILTEPAFEKVNLTLYLRNAARLDPQVATNARVRVVEGDIIDATTLMSAMAGQDLVFLATVDTGAGQQMTKDVIASMKANQVDRILAASSIGVYHEEPNPDFAKWNQTTLADALPLMRAADQILRVSDLNFTTLRFAWMNDQPAVHYQITEGVDLFAGVSGSRASMADAVLQIIADPEKYDHEAIGVSDPDTKDAPEAVY